MWLNRGTSGSDSDSWIGSLTYQSKASRTPTEAELQELTTKARAKNRSLGLTGMLLYDGDRFFQTLEGPPAQLKSVWEAISRDPRHTDLDILSEHIVPARLFDGWDLLVYNNDPHLRVPHGDSSVIRELVERVPSLTKLALDGNDLETNRLIASLTEEGWEGEAVLTHLIEPTARALGDAWLDDRCSEFDLTIGLSMLQLAGHAVRHNPTPEAIRNRRYSILLATAPGEQHMLGTSLLADLFTDAGWSVDVAYPDSNQALVNQLKKQQPDAVDIGMSDALPRQHTLKSLRETIERSRFAAPDHLTVVSVGGRLFAEAAATADSVGADLARKTVAGSTIRIAELIKQKRQERDPE